MRSSRCGEAHAGFSPCRYDCSSVPATRPAWLPQNTRSAPRGTPRRRAIRDASRKFRFHFNRNSRRRHTVPLDRDTGGAGRHTLVPSPRTRNVLSTASTGTATCVVAGTRLPVNFVSLAQVVGARARSRQLVPRAACRRRVDQLPPGRFKDVSEAFGAVIGREGRAPGGDACVLEQTRLCRRRPSGLRCGSHGRGARHRFSAPNRLVAILLGGWFSFG